MPPLETDCVAGGLPVPALGTHQLLGPLDRAVGGQVALQEHALRAVGAALGPGEEQVRRLDEAGHRAVDWGGGTPQGSWGETEPPCAGSATQ